MAEMVPVTITGVVRGTEDGSARRERFFIELAAAAEGDARRLRIGVGDAEAAALASSLRGQEFPRPMTYQFVASLLAAAGSGVRSVRVTGMTDGIFYAQVLLRGGAAVDARPSDAINLAAVTGSPVYVASELLGVPAGAARPASSMSWRKNLRRPPAPSPGRSPASPGAHSNSPSSPCAATAPPRRPSTSPPRRCCSAARTSTTG